MAKSEKVSSPVFRQEHFSQSESLSFQFSLQQKNKVAKNERKKKAQIFYRQAKSCTFSKIESENATIHDFRKKKSESPLSTVAVKS